MKNMVRKIIYKVDFFIGLQTCGNNLRFPYQLY